MIGQAGPHSVVQRLLLFSEVSYFYVPSAQLGERDRYTFLFDSCPTDCRERLEQSSFSPDGEHFAFRIGNSSRYDSGTRLLLFDVQDGDVRTLLDETDAEVTGYRFTDSTLVYTVRGGGERIATLG